MPFISGEEENRTDRKMIKEILICLISVDVEETRRKEFDENHSIYRILKMVDITMEMTEELILKCKTYYNFLMTTPLKNYIQPCYKLEGKTFSQMEGEFLLYYRMIRGVEKVHEEME